MIRPPGARDVEVLGDHVVLPDDRQKLYGDVGFRILDANVRERLRRPNPEEPAWC